MAEYLITLLVFCLLILCFFLFFKILGHLFTYAFWGGINFASPEDKIKQIIEFAKIEAGQKAIDLGSGEGRVVVALAKAGAIAYGCEVNPFLVAKSKNKIKQEGLSATAFITAENLWKKDLSDFDIVVVYPMRHMLKMLEKKFERELKPGTKVISNGFSFPTWRPEKSKNNVYLYIK